MEIAKRVINYRVIELPPYSKVIRLPENVKSAFIFVFI